MSELGNMLKRSQMIQSNPNLQQLMGEIMYKTRSYALAIMK
jgi:hypothetical protein